MHQRNILKPKKVVNSNTYKARFENHFQGCVSGMSRCNELDWLQSFGPECGHFLLCVWILYEAPVCSVSSAQHRQGQAVSRPPTPVTRGHDTLMTNWWHTDVMKLSPVSVTRSFPRPLPDPEKQGGDDFVAPELFKDFFPFDNWILKESWSWLASDQTFS